MYSHRCPLAGRKMHTHWLHIYRCSQTRLKAYRCPPVRLHVCTWLQVHRCPQTWLRACRCPQARLQVQPRRYPQARLQVQTCRCLPQARLQVCRCQQARLQIYTCCPYGLRVPVYVPPTSDTTQPMGSGHPSKASHSQCRPGLKSGVSSCLKIFLTANLFTRTHSVRVPALSAGAGASSTSVHAVSQQVLKQAEIQKFIGNQVLLTPFVVVNAL